MSWLSEHSLPAPNSEASLPVSTSPVQWDPRRPGYLPPSKGIDVQFHDQPPGSPELQEPQVVRN